MHLFKIIEKKISMYFIIYLKPTRGDTKHKTS